MKAVRRRLYILLDPKAWPDRGLSPLNVVICCVIFSTSLLAIIETEQTITAEYGTLLDILEVGSAALFLLEYSARVWTSVENPRYGDSLQGRLRYVVSPMALVDLIALLPFLFFWTGSEVFLIRLVRVVRVLRLARLGRFSDAITHVVQAIRSRSYELILTLAGAAFLLVVSSTFLYIAEGDAQPHAFGSIPRAMWWSVVTLTTVGYGDVYPITVVGKLFAAITAITGIGLIAMPTGILAAAFSEGMQRHRNGQSEAGR